MKNYVKFLQEKMAIAHESGFEVSEADLTPTLFPHVKDTVRWAVHGGCRAIFSSFGMQKTVTQLEICRIIVAKKGGKALIVCPKRVVVEFVTQAKAHLNMEVQYVRTMQEVQASTSDIMITNYERVRDGEDGVRIDNLCMIAHNVIIGDHTAMAAQTGIAGSTEVGKYCIFAGQVGIAGHLKIADHTTILAQGGVIGNIRKGGQVLLGSPVIDAKLYMKAYALFKRAAEE